MDKKIIRMYTGTDGKSHFQDVNIILRDEGNPDVLLTELIKATGLIFIQLGGHLDNEWRKAPRRQFFIPVRGEIEIELGDGTKLRFGPGDILLAEDTAGQGHLIRVVGEKTMEAMLITLD